MLEKSLFFRWCNSPGRAYAAPFEVSRSHTIRYTQTQARARPVGLQWTSDQLFAEAAT